MVIERRPGEIVDGDLLSEVGPSTCGRSALETIVHGEAELRIALGDLQLVDADGEDRRRADGVNGGLRTASDAVPKPLLAQVVHAIDRPPGDAGLRADINGYQRVPVLQGVNRH